MGWIAKWFRSRGIWKSVPRCHSPPHLRDTPITEVPSSAFACDGECRSFLGGGGTVSFGHSPFVSFFVSADEVGCSGMTEDCPKGCECQGTAVRCTRGNLRAIPENIPVHTTEL